MSFPIVLWGDTRAAFLTAGEVLPEAPLSAALVFALQEGDFILADIAGRGWCIPGGHIEATESGEEAARREVWEEIGATLGPLHLLGHYVLAPLHTETSQTNTNETIEPKSAKGQHHLVVAYWAEVIALEALPHGSESKGIRRCPYKDLQTHYYTWDVLLETVFAYVSSLCAAHNAAL